MKEILIKPHSEIVMYSQRNNIHDPYRACFPTSLAMALRNNGYPEIKATTALDDEIMLYANSNEMKSFADKIGVPRGTKYLNEWWSVMEKVANDYLKKANIQLKAKWKANTNYRDIESQINKGRMPIIGTTLVKLKNGAWGGHIVCVAGYNENMQYIICDPFGNANTNYQDTKGFCITLNPDLMGHISTNSIIFESI